MFTLLRYHTARVQRSISTLLTASFYASHCVRMPLTFMRYTEKSYCLLGEEAKPYVEILKSLFGKYNSSLTHPVSKTAVKGWIVSQGKKDFFLKGLAEHKISFTDLSNSVTEINQSKPRTPRPQATATSPAQMTTSVVLQSPKTPEGFKQPREVPNAPRRENERVRTSKFVEVQKEPPPIPDKYDMMADCSKDDKGKRIMNHMIKIKSIDGMESNGIFYFKSSDKTKIDHQFDKYQVILNFKRLEEDDTLSESSSDNDF